MQRRQFLAASLGVGAGLLLPRRLVWAQAAEGPYTLGPLPYAYDALEPHIDARTMEIHHTRHHAAYVNNLNAAVSGTDWAKKTPEQLVAHLDALPEDIRTTVRNNGGGHVNHELFWTIMSPKGGGQPKGALAAAVDAQLGGFDALLGALSDAALRRFGSGWAWLSVEPASKRLVVGSTPNQDTPVMAGHVPILGIDVWEHAYYLKYQNRRADYVKAFFHVVDWDAVAARYADALKG
jgi:superoxide dismutase, Fe-Mn family